MADKTGVTPKPIAENDAKGGAVWFRFAGLGMELAGITLLFAGVGYWIDAWRNHDQMVVTALSTLVGFGLAMTRFIIKASSPKP
ncbi:membrane protein [Rhodopirellula maiorica SM1]|uniref:Membrane protein n=1 Tax=Rhodopirellula maiorica SM1 TaxID=1265738 RepID=M5RPL4_9BACT|nr:AtpZ/AtpI family protein [Rhodopirellula maiorica]EMI21161.1 membrane protein [Rhodopirellula maiorica SM1]